LLLSFVHAKESNSVFKYIVATKKDAETSSVSLVVSTTIYEIASPRRGETRNDDMLHKKSK
jgi:hypothetical protein